MTMPDRDLITELRRLANATLAETHNPGWPYGGGGPDVWSECIDGALGGPAGKYCAATHPDVLVGLLDELEQLRSGERMNVYVAEELVTLRTRVAELERENIRLSGIEQLHCGDRPVPDDKAEWWTPPMRTPIGQWIKGMFEHPCDGMPYSEDGYDARGPIITVRNLLRSVRMAEREEVQDR